MKKFLFFLAPSWKTCSSSFEFHDPPFGVDRATKKKKKRATAPVPIRSKDPKLIAQRQKPKKYKKGDGGGNNCFGMRSARQFPSDLMRANPTRVCATHSVHARRNHTCDYADIELFLLHTLHVP